MTYRNRNGSSPDCTALEARLLFSSSPIALLPGDCGLVCDPVAQVDVLHDQPDSSTDAWSLWADDVQLDPPPESTTPSELVFVDSNVDNFESLLEDIRQSSIDDQASVEVIILPSGSDGIETISAALEQRTNIDAIHIISHGKAGGVQLGNMWLTNETLAAHAGAIAEWNHALTSDADLLFYGCNLASNAQGQELLDSIGALCDCDVAASEDLTGHTDVGGDWDLEFTVGLVETEVAFSVYVQTNWSGLLDSAILNPTQDAYIQLKNPTTNDGMSGSMVIDRESTDLQRALAQFDVSSIPVGSTITSATLQLESTQVGGSITIEAYQLLEAWAEGSNTWTDSSFGTPWSTAGGEFNATAIDSITINSIGQHSFDITSLVQDWVDGTEQNYGVLVGSPDGGGNRTATYDSREGTTAPQLVINYTPPPTSLWLTTDGAASGTPGLGAWSGGDVVQMGDPNLAFEPGTTNGTFSGIVNFDTFLAGAKPDALHYVTREITVGVTTKITLYEGDLLFSTVSDGTLTSSNSLLVQDEDLIIYRPDTPGDYSTGMFYTLIDYTDINTGDRMGYTLVEQDTSIGDAIVQAGTFLYSKNGAPEIYHLVLDQVGDTTTATTDAVLMEGQDIGLGASDYFDGIELIESDTTIGGTNLTAGQILVSLNVNGNVGDTPISVKHQDVFILDVNTTGATTSADATMFLEGLDAQLDDLAGASENITGLTLVGQSLTASPTLVVDTTEDYSNLDAKYGNTSSILALLADKGTDGLISLREAIDATNNTANFDASTPDQIHFNISTADSGYVDPDATPATGDEYWTILVDASGLPYLLDPVIVDATTQLGYDPLTGRPVIELDGSVTPSASGINGIALRTNDSIVRGFVVHSFADEGMEIDGSTGFGDNNTFQNNWVGIDAEGNLAGNAEHAVMISVDATGNQIGGTGVNDGNVIAGATAGFSGLVIQNNSDNNTVQGNYIGVMPDGTTAAPNGDDGVTILFSSDNNLIGGMAPGAGNVISGNAGEGILIDGTTNGTYTTVVTDTLVQGNFIGTDASGTIQVANGDDGINVKNGATNNTIGGNTASHRNIISGNTADGIYLESAGNAVLGNYIGTDVTGTLDLGNSNSGVRAWNAGGSNAIGGVNPGEGNLIAFNHSDGVEIHGTTTGASILGNSIYRNVGLGIDLGSDGVTANDGGDADSGANDLQNTAVFTMVSHSLGTTTVNFDLDWSGSAKNYRVEFFVSQLADHSGSGEGESLVHSQVIAHTGSGNESFVAALATSEYAIISATVTEDFGGSYGNTSEFSAVRNAQGGGVLVVDTTNDLSNGDTSSVANLISNRGDGLISLREAIEASNSVPGTFDIIQFDIAPGGIQTIVLTGVYQNITDSAVLDATTQYGYAGAPLIELDGTATTGSNNGITLAASAAGSTVKGFIIHSFADEGIEVIGDNNIVQNNWVGLNSAGAADPNGGDGIILAFAASGNLIGGAGINEGNVVSGNAGGGITLRDAGTDGNFVYGNLIGVAADGVTIRANGADGIWISTDVANNLIGGTVPGQTNVISGNTASGILVSTAGVNNVISGNHIGTDETGLVGVGNLGHGIEIVDSASTVVGGNTASHRNVISGNTLSGVSLWGVTTSLNTIQGNIIGLDATGTTIIGNTGHGVYIYSSANGNFVGGTAAGARNIISGNNYGVYISGIGSDANVIEGNYIGTDITGTLDRGNTASGVRISAGANNIVGGSTAASRNIISGNDGSGVLISALSASGNLIQGNYIGTDVSGTLDLGNSQHGVWVSGSPSNTIDGNLISGNDVYGIYVSGATATGSVVTGNLIGTNVAGTAPLLNGDHAIYLNGVDSTTIGGNTAAARNVINSAAGKYGLDAFSATNTTIEGNYLGTDIAGTTQLAGGSFAINVVDSGTTIIGGSTTAEANVIAGYSVTGINVSGAASSGTQIAGNFVGTDTGGTLDLTSGIYGITLQLSAAGVLIGGPAPGQGNTIAYNSSNGIRLMATAGTGNQIRRNRIYNNGGIGIDLEGDGISANDAADGDSGANDVLNFPVLYNVVFSGPNVIITGEARPGATVEFFKVANDGDTHGEAAEYIGTGVVSGSTPGNDDPTARQFSFSFAVGSLVATDLITATATDAANNTSEFSANIGVNNAPVESTIEGTNISYTENDAATQITNTISIADLDDTNIESAVVQITANYANGQDILAFTDIGPITGSWNAALGTLTLTGSDTLANYEAALRTITYVNTSDDPSALTRTVSFTVNDGDVDSNTLTRNIDVTPVNDAPVESTIEGTNISYTENDAATQITNTISIADLDDTNIESAVVQITANYASGQDILAFTDIGPITGSWNAALGTLTLTGSDTLANYESALRTITYVNTSDDPSALTRTVSFNVNDGDNNSNIQTRDITVAAINDDPTNSASLPGDISVIEEMASNVDLSLVNLTDIDAGASNLTVTLSTSAGGLLTATTGGGVTVVGSGTASITLTGNLTNLNTFLDTASNVQYTGLTDLVGNDVDTIDVDVTDNGNTGAGGGGTIALGTVNVDITSVNDAPVEATIEGVALAYTENDAPTAITATITITDLDDTNIESATIQITGNYANGQDVLAFTNTGTITGVWNAFSGTLTLTGTDTLANYEAALRSVTFENTSENPSTLTRTVSFTVNDGDNNSNVQTRDITITSINDDPTAVGALPADINVIEETASSVDFSSVNLVDFDAGTSNLTVTLSTSAGGLLTASTGGGVTVVGSGTASITLTGNLANLNTFLDAASNVQYTGLTDLVGNDVDTIDVDVTDNGNTGGGGGGAITLGTVNVDITSVNDAPVEATIEGVALAYTENDAPTAITATITITDLDDTNIESATIQITGNYANGQDVLAFTNTGTITGVWNAVSGTLTLTGTDTLANYEAAVRSVTYENTSENPSILTRTVSFTVNDGDSNSNVQTRDITITSINDDPTAVGALPADINVIEETASSVDFSSVNLVDFDADSSNLTVTLSTSAGGILTANTGGGVTVIGSATSTITLTGSVTDLNTFLDTASNVRYTGTVNLIGNDVDTIQIDVTDNGNTGAGGGGTITLGTVNVDITSANDNPVIVSDGGGATALISVAENTTAVTTVTATDADLPADILTFSITGGADATQFAVDSSTGMLTLVIGKDYESPTDGNADGIYEVQVTVDDGNGGTDVQTIRVNITDANDAPVAVLNNYAVDEGATLNIMPSGVLANDIDDDGDALSVSLVAGPTHGTLTLNPDGSFTYTHDGSETITDSLTYQVSDGNGGFDTGVVNLTINPVNDTPIAVADSYVVNEGATLNITPSGVLANDADIEADPLTAIPIAGPTHGTLTLNLDGSFTYTHDGSETTSDSFTYQLSDGNGGFDTAMVSLTINPVNDVPVATLDTFTVDEGSTLNIMPNGVLANDSDADGDPLSVSLVAAPINGIVTLNPDGSFSYTHNGSETANDSFIYQVDDGNGGLSTATVTISVTPANDAPTISSSPTDTTAEDVPLTFSAVNGNPITVADGDAATHLLVVTLDGTNGRISLASTVNLTFATGTGVGDTIMEFVGTMADINAALDGLTFTPDPNFYGAASIDIVVNDQGNIGTGGDITDAARIDIAVTPINDAPIAADDAFTMAPGEPALLLPTNAILNNDTDVDGDPIVALIATLPVHGNAVAAADGSIIYTPPAGFVGSDSFTYWARDPDGAGGLATVTISVSPIAPPPPAGGGGDATDDSISTPGDGPSSPPVTPVVIAAPVTTASSETATDVSGVVRNPSIRADWLDVPHAFTGEGELQDIPLAEAEGSGLKVTDLVGGRLDNATESVSNAVGTTTTVPSYSFSQSFLSGLEDLADSMQLAEELRTTIGVGLGVAGTAASIGYLIWTVRSGYVYASMLASTPVWSRVDPLPVIDFRTAHAAERRRGDGGSLVDTLKRELRMAT